MHMSGLLRASVAGMWLTHLHRLAGRGAERLRRRDLPALLDRDDILILDTETTDVDAGAEIIELVAIDTTGTLRLSALALAVVPISRRSRQIHGLSDEALHAEGARTWPEVHEELVRVLREASKTLAWRADFDARVLEQTAARHHLELPPVHWADVRPAYVEARPWRRHSLAAAMRRERLAWEGPHHRAEADCRAVLAVMRRLADPRPW